MNKYIIILLIAIFSLLFVSCENNQSSQNTVQQQAVQTSQLPKPSYSIYLEKGDYETALKEIRPLAEKGDASAQYDLGVYYEKDYGDSQGDVRQL